MYFYDVGYWSGDEGRSVQLQHAEKFTKGQLEQQVFTATERALRYAIAHPDKHCIGRYGVSFEILFDEVVKELVKMGFKRLKFATQFDVFGLASVVGGDDWDKRDREDKVLTRLRNAMPEDLKQQALEISRSRKQTS